MYSSVWPGRKRIFFLQVNLHVWFNRHWIISMSCPVLQEYRVICAGTLLKWKPVKINSNSYGSTSISWNLMKGEILIALLRVLPLVEISSAFPVFCICHVIIKVCFSNSDWTMYEKSWKHRLLCSSVKCSCFVNKIFNILGKLGLGTRVQNLFPCKHLYPPWLLGVT